MRGQVCSLQLLLDLASTVIQGSDYCRTLDHILLPEISDSPDLEGLVLIFMSPRNSVTLHYYQQSVGQSVLVSGTHLGPIARIILLSGSCSTAVVPSLMRGWVCSLQLQLVLPAQSFSGFESPGTLNHICLRIRSSDLYLPGTGWPSYTWRNWVPFLSPLNTTHRATVEIFELHPRNSNKLSVTQIKVEVILWLMVSWQFCLGVRHPSEAHEQIVVSVVQLRICWCWVPSLMRRQVCSLQLLLGLASAVLLGCKSFRTHDRIFHLKFRTPKPGRSGSHIYFPPGIGYPVILPGTGFV
jgi:hypothetical protein